MKVLSIWAMKLVGGQSESKKILIPVAETKATQRQAEMKDGWIGKGQGKEHGVMLVAENFRVVLSNFGSSLKFLSFSWTTKFLFVKPI